MRRLAVLVALALVLAGQALAAPKNSDPCNPPGIHTQQYVC